MTLRIVTYLIDEGTQQVTTEKDIERIEFEDQNYLGNGTWLHCLRKDPNKNVSIQFDPATDWFEIF